MGPYRLDGGDPAAAVTGVAIALDPTVDAVRCAHDCAANVLLTHHPVFIDAPSRVRAAGAGAYGSETVVYEAARTGVALMNFHTALDVSAAAAQVLPRMLGLEYTGILDAIDSDAPKGYGQMCTVAKSDRPFQLKTMAARCMAVFGRTPRVWGAMETPVSSVVTATGSAGTLVEKCLNAHVDCLVCGEMHYHDALAAREAGLTIVELGHDVSELPLCAVLGAALEKIGFPEQSIKAVDQSSN